MMVHNTGLGLLHCGYCGAAVVGQTLLSRRRKADGTPQDGHRRLLCSGTSTGIGCEVSGSVSVVPVGERAESLHVRVSPSQREKVARNGGGQWVRALIDAAHEKNS